VILLTNIGNANNLFTEDIDKFIEFYVWQRGFHEIIQSMRIPGLITGIEGELEIIR
jgi:hypothetical protein